MTPADVLKLIKEKEAKFADLRFTDTIGKEQHVTVPTRLVDEGFFKDGKMFDGSSIAGWKGINESDMILMPDPSTAIIDPPGSPPAPRRKRPSNRRPAEMSRIDHPAFACHPQKRGLSNYSREWMVT